jgi:hypothetical protein
MVEHCSGLYQNFIHPATECKKSGGMSQKALERV